jgi:hypothetical protein
MKAVLSFLTFCSLAALCAIPALADDSGVVPGAISYRIGVLWPTSSGDRQASGDTPIALGLDYSLAQAEASPLAVSSFYADFWGGKENGKHASTFALGFSERVYDNEDPDSNTKNNQMFYYGGGVGPYFVDTSSKSQSVLGGKLIAGLAFGQTAFLEFSYNLVPSVGGINTSGLALQVGFKH